MKTLILLVFICYNSFVYSQKSWFSSNEEWYYYGKDNTYIKGNIEKDSLINDTLVSKLVYKRYSQKDTITYCAEYVANIENKIFHWDRYNREFYKLYDFNAKVGDTIVIRNKSFYGTLNNCLVLNTYFPYKYWIREIDTITVSGTEIIRQKVESESYHFHTIYELIGSDWLFFGGDIPIYITNDDYFRIQDGGIRCYSDSLIKYKTVDSCECSFNNTNIKMIYNECNFKIVNNQLVFDKDKQRIIVIYNQIGHEISRYNVEIPSTSVYIELPNSGIYFIQIKEENRVFMKKIKI